MLIFAVIRVRWLLCDDIKTGMRLRRQFPTLVGLLSLVRALAERKCGREQILIFNERSIELLCVWNWEGARSLTLMALLALRCSRCGGNCFRSCGTGAKKNVLCL